jgi:hypothetical protein
VALAMYEDDPGRPRFWDVFGALSLLPDVTELYFGPNGGRSGAFVRGADPAAGRIRRPDLGGHLGRFFRAGPHAGAKPVRRPGFGAVRRLRPDDRRRARTARCGK